MLETKLRAYPRKGQMVADYDYRAPISFVLGVGWIASGQFPADCIAACSASGSVDSAVAHWCAELKFAEALEPVRPLVEQYIKEFGAWDDLTTASIETLAHRVLWSACCDIREQGEWLGLVH